MLNPIPFDDQMLSGQTYTFSFKLGNWFSLPDAATIQTDILNFGPQYVNNLGVTQASGVGLFTNYYNVTFTYGGDGSDVVNEVGTELATAAQQGSNDSLNFESAFLGTQGISAGSEIGSAVQTGVTAVKPALPSTSTLIIIVVGIALVVFAMSGGTALARRATA